MKKQWITLFPDTFLWAKENAGIIYNSKKFQGFQFHVNDRIAEICGELSNPDNLYTTDFASGDEEVRKWVDSITKICAGYLTSGTEKRPVSFKPILKILNDVDYYVWEHQQGFGGNLMLNVHELTFYLNNTETGSDTWFRQAIFPLKKNCSQLDVTSIISFIRYSRNPFLSNINLVGNIFLYPDYKKLINEIANLSVNFTIQITIQDFADHMRDIKSLQWPDHIWFNVLTDSSSISACSRISLHDIEASVSVTVFVSSENEYDSFLDRFKDIPIYSNAQMIPVYLEDNLDVFEDNIFTEQEDLDEITLTKREIFMHQTLNTNDFGKLTIFPDGLVYANVNMEPLGTIENTVYSLVYKELTKGKSWRRIRDMKPCSDCLYQWLCPSPSNYELVIGRPNLCHVKP